MTHHNHTRLTLSRAIKLLRNNRITCSELVTYCYTIAKEGEMRHKLNAFCYLMPLDKLLLNARASQYRIDNGIPLSFLDGIPVSFKGNIAVRELPLTAHSSILCGSTACAYDGHVSMCILREGGAILIGLTSMDEFGMGSLGKNINCHLQDNKTFLTRNPLYLLRDIYGNDQNNNKKSTWWDDNWCDRIKSLDVGKLLVQNHFFPSKEKIYSPGGSSSGSAGSIAFGSSLISIATDTGGSVRLPASWCGIVGIKPTYGSISRFGIVSYASSLDTVGVLGLSVQCTSIVLDQLLNKSEDKVMDSTSIYLHRDVQESVRDINPNLEGIRIGIPEAFSLRECPLIIRRVWKYAAQLLHNSGATIHVVPCNILSPEIIKFSMSAYYVLACAEASSNLSRYDGIQYGKSFYSNEDNINVKFCDIILNKMTPLESKSSRHRVKHLGIEALRRIMFGTIVLSSNEFISSYELGSRLRALLVKQFNVSFEGLNNNNLTTGNCYVGVDLMLIPTALYGPPNLMGYDHFDNKSDIDFKFNGNKEFANDVMTVPISLAGLPSASVPMCLLDVITIEKVKKASFNELAYSIENHKIHNNNIYIYPEDLKINKKKTKASKQPVVGIQVFGPKMSECIMLQVARVLEISHNTPFY